MTNALFILLTILPGQTPAPAVSPRGFLPAQTDKPVPGPAPTADEAPPAFPTEEQTPLEDLAQRLYGSGEYLYWWLRDARLPPWLTTSSPAAGGVLGVGDTSVLYGSDRSGSNDRFSGARVTLGYWFAKDRFGVEFEAFFLPSVHSTFTATSNGSRLLALPFTDAVSGSPASTIIAGPSAGSGSFTAYTATQLYGQQVNFVMLLAGDDVNSSIDYLGGLRFLEMHDRLNQTTISQNAAVGTVSDQFYTHSTFYGFTFGLRGKVNWGALSMQVRGLGALGGTDQEVQTSGTSSLSGSPGFYVQNSNLGIFRRTRFDMVYETGVNLAWQPLPWLSVFGGYTFLWWVNPIRAGDQVDTTLNFTSAGPVRPLIPFKQDALTAQGLNVGLALQW